MDVLEITLKNSTVAQQRHEVLLYLARAFKKLFLLTALQLLRLNGFGLWNYEDVSHCGVKAMCVWLS